MKAIDFQIDKDGIALVTVDVKDKPMNVITPEFMDDIAAAAESSEALTARRMGQGVTRGRRRVVAPRGPGETAPGTAPVRARRRAARSISRFMSAFLNPSANEYFSVSGVQTCTCASIKPSRALAHKPLCLVSSASPAPETPSRSMPRRDGNCPPVES